MASIDESGLVGKTRDQPISARLRRVLLAAAEDADVDIVSVASGGQPGSSGQRTGSHRHDGGDAADLDLIKDRRALKFTDSRDLDTFKRFVTSAAARGANGIGAAEAYMGPSRIHVGFGNGPKDTTNVVWGAGGTSTNAPAWLRQAAQSGWAHPISFDPEIPDEPEAQIEGEIMADDSDVERFRPLLDFIASHEVGTTGDPGYNTSLDNGKHLPNRREQILVTQTLDDIDKLQTFMLRSSKSSAIGRYQIVRTTLRGLRSKLGLTGRELYSSALQDRLGVTLINGRGRSVTGLRNEWESLKKVDAQTILAKYDERPRVGTGAVGTHEDEDTTPSSLADLLQMILNRIQPAGTAGRVDGDWPVLKQGVNNEDAVKRLQSTLNDLRYYTGGADGRFGSITRSAVALFQLDNGLPVTGNADAETWAALTNGSARPLTEQRVALNADDMRKLGSQTVRNADFTRYAGWLAGVLGLGGLGKSGACTMDPTISATLCNAVTTSPTTTTPSLSSTLQSVDVLQKALAGAATDPGVSQLLQGLDLAHQSLQKAVTTAAPVAQQAMEQANSSGLTSLLTSSLVGLLPGGWAGSLLALGLGVAVNTFGNRIINRRVSDQRDGKNIGSLTT